MPPSNVASTLNTTARLAALCLVCMGCGRQLEGERCNIGSGDENCETGLRCVSLAERNQGTFGAICCPDRDPTVDRCRTRPVPLTEDPDAAEPPLVAPVATLTQPRSLITEQIAEDAGQLEEHRDAAPLEDADAAR